jgi:hypothetical protein
MVSQTNIRSSLDAISFRRYARPVPPVPRSFADRGNRRTNRMNRDSHDADPDRAVATCSALRCSSRQARNQRLALRRGKQLRYLIAKRNGDDHSGTDLELTDRGCTVGRNTRHACSAIFVV